MSGIKKRLRNLVIKMGEIPVSVAGLDEGVLWGRMGGIGDRRPPVLDEVPVGPLRSLKIVRGFSLSHPPSLPPLPPSTYTI